MLFGGVSALTPFFTMYDQLKLFAKVNMFYGKKNSKALYISNRGAISKAHKYKKK